MLPLELNFFKAVEDEDEEGSSVDGENVKEIIEEKEIEGVVTSLRDIHGLIDSDIIFLTTVCSGLNIPKVGDRVRAKVCRGRTSEFWRAMAVSKCSNFWEDYDLDINFANDDEKEKLKAKKEQRKTEMQYMEKLLKDKFGVDILGENFGCMDMHCKKSVNLVLRNQGSGSQTLLKYNMVGFSQQMHMGPLKIDLINLKEQSKKIQETLPMILDPGMSAVLTVICNAKYIGKESQMIVFDFEKFKIGKELSVNVGLPSLLVEHQEQYSHMKSNAVEKVQRSRQDLKNRSLVVIPGPSLGCTKEKKYYRSKLYHYLVPEILKDCLLENKQLSKVVPCLRKPLDISNYVERFKALLHIEDVQHEIEMRDFDIMETQMEVNGEFLNLKVPGRLEGRQNLIQRDKVIVTKTENTDLSGKVSYTGTVHEVFNDTISLKFSPDFHRDFDPDQTYTVTFLANRNTIRRCHRAVELVSKFKSEVLFPRNISLKTPQVNLIMHNKNTTVMPTRHKSSARSSNQLIKFFNNNLNERQKFAVMRILHGEARPLPYVIFGPPGTGKTITVVEAILQILSNIRGVRILACTPSNSAADLLTERLYDTGQVSKHELVRLCGIVRSGEVVSQTVKPFCAYIEDKDLDLESKTIVICTCSTAGSLYKGSNSEQIINFSHVFVDEAGQATEPECMIAVAMAPSPLAQVVLAGDPQQLGAVLKSNKAKEYGLDVSYLERLCALPLYQWNVEKFPDSGGYNPLLITKLVDNYRCHHALISLSSCMFYDDELKAKGDLDLVNCLSSWEELPNKCNFPILFHGVRGEDLREENNPSWFNSHEVVLTVRYLKSLLLNEKYALSSEDIGVITPYRKQAEKIRLMAEKFDLPRVKVGTVEEFQGQERVAIIISTVRSSESNMDQDIKYTLGFLGNPKRFNVSITRAHSLLVVVGNPHILCQDIYWGSLIKYCVDNGAYIGCDLPINLSDGNFFQEASESSSNLLTESFQSDTLQLESRSVTREREQLIPKTYLGEKESDLLQGSCAKAIDKSSETTSLLSSSLLTMNEKTSETNPSISFIKTDLSGQALPITTESVDLLPPQPPPHERHDPTVITSTSNGDLAPMITNRQEISINHELDMKIAKQIEYYFGEINLRKDQFLLQIISECPDGWVDISLLMSFNKMKAMNVTVQDIADVMRRHSNVIQVSNDGLRLRRDPDRPIEKDLEKWKEDLYSRSVILRNYPSSELLEKMQNFFEFYGQIIHIERNVLLKVWANTNFYNMQRCDLIIFDDHHSARNLAKHRYTRLQKMGLELFFMDDLVKQCLSFFIQKKIQNIPHPIAPAIRKFKNEGIPDSRRGRRGKHSFANPINRVDVDCNLESKKDRHQEEENDDGVVVVSSSEEVHDDSE